MLEQFGLVLLMLKTKNHGAVDLPVAKSVKQWTPTVKQL
jgi:hypothetical protein